MANLADCAVAIAKSDLQFMNGAIVKAENDDGQDKYEYVTKQYYKVKDKNDEWVLLSEDGFDGKDTYSRRTLKKNGEVVLESNKDWGKIQEAINSFGLEQEWERFSVLRDNFTSKGWKVDWKKLNAYSYDYTPSVGEYEDHITIYFGGRWSFPTSLEDKLNEYGVLWQGAGCEDGCDWQDDEMGNSDFGLRVKSETEYCDGEPYTQHYVEDTSE